MSLLRNHIVLMFLYAVATALYFSILWKDTREKRIRSFLVIFCSLFLGGIILGWAMFPFPMRSAGVAPAERAAKTPALRHPR